MGEVLQKYETRLRGRNGHRYEAQACGLQRDDGAWEGWLEFPSLDGGQTIISHRETTQPTREYLVYWATGLTDPYLDGALLRALTNAPVPRTAMAAAAAAEPRARPAAAHVSSMPPHAVLDPFHVYAEGDEILRGQLHALSAAQLRNIALAHRLTDRTPGEIEQTSKPALITLIMAAVERHAG